MPERIAWRKSAKAYSGTDFESIARKGDGIMMKFVVAASCLALACFGTAGGSSAAELETHINSIGMEFVLIPAGSFTAKNGPKVVVSKPFYLGKYEVTQAQWVAGIGRATPRELYRSLPEGPPGVWTRNPWRDSSQPGHGSNPARFRNPNNPVEKVSWNDVQVFIKLLNAKEGHNRYRLPTSMEWELAARGGTGSERFFTEGRLEDYTWFRDNSDGAAHPVGQKKPNPYGLHDIYGNVMEWVHDWWRTGLPEGRELKDYRGPESDPSSFRMLRGGGWQSFPDRCSSFFRDGGYLHWRMDDIGFRLALTLE